MLYMLNTRMVGERTWEGIGRKGIMSLLLFQQSGSKAHHIEIDCESAT